MKKIVEKLKSKNTLILILIFLFALAVRFRWFPKNVYFGYDQARDAIVSQEIYTQKDIKIIGPSAGKEGLFHGPAYWYLIGPVYLLFKGNPNGVLAFISIINAAGIFLIYLLAKELFNSKIGLIASFFYAVSFAQTQYSLYFANPSPAVLSIMVFYLGWCWLIFRKNSLGWLLVGLGFGLSIQFEFFLIYLFSSMILFPVFFWKEIRTAFSIKSAVLGILSLSITLFTFILAEFKYGFKTIKQILGMFFPNTLENAPKVHLATSNYLGRVGMEVYYDVFKVIPNTREILAVLLFIIIALCFFKFKESRKKIIFLLVWIISNLFLDIFGPPQLYYVGIGLSIPIMIIFAFSFSQLYNFKKIPAFLLLAIFIFTNLHLMNKYNPGGPVKDLYVQNGMFLTDEKKVIDAIYTEADNKKFTINALTMPYKIKTTWAYLFNWYGMEKYRYVPFWGGEDVPGYAGILPLPDRREYVRFAIFEPMRGIPEDLKKEFKDSENGYSYPKSIIKIGLFEVEKRIP